MILQGGAGEAPRAHRADRCRRPHRTEPRTSGGGVPTRAGSAGESRLIGTGAERSPQAIGGVVPWSYGRGIRFRRPRRHPMKIRHLVHSCLLVEMAGRRVLVDPGTFSGGGRAGAGRRRARRASTPSPSRTSTPIISTAACWTTSWTRAAGRDVIAEPETAAQLAESSEDGAAVSDATRLLPLSRRATAHEFPAWTGQEALRIEAGGRSATQIIHPDIPRVGNIGLVLSAGGRAASRDHGRLPGASAGVPRDRRPRLRRGGTVVQDVRDHRLPARGATALALPVHDAMASDGGRAIYLRQSGTLSPPRAPRCVTGRRTGSSRSTRD